MLLMRCSYSACGATPSSVCSVHAHPPHMRQGLSIKHTLHASRASDAKDEYAWSAKQCGRTCSASTGFARIALSQKSGMPGGGSSSSGSPAATFGAAAASAGLGAAPPSSPAGASFSPVTMALRSS